MDWIGNQIRAARILDRGWKLHFSCCSVLKKENESPTRRTKWKKEILVITNVSGLFDLSLRWMITCRMRRSTSPELLLCLPPPLFIAQRWKMTWSLSRGRQTRSHWPDATSHYRHFGISRTIEALCNRVTSEVDQNLHEQDVRLTAAALPRHVSFLCGAASTA